MSEHKIPDDLKARYDKCCHPDEPEYSAWECTLIERIAKLEAERDALKLEAEIQAQEARGQRATVHEIYRIVTDGKGEPGDWNGAAPVREAFAQLRAARDKAWRHISETSVALQTPVGMNNAEYGKQLSAALAMAFNRMDVDALLAARAAGKGE